MSVRECGTIHTRRDVRVRSACVVILRGQYTSSVRVHAMPSVPVRYRRAEKGLFAQKIQHAIPSFVVLGHGVNHLQHDPQGGASRSGWPKSPSARWSSDPSFAAFGSCARKRRRRRRSRTRIMASTGSTCVLQRCWPSKPTHGSTRTGTSPGPRFCWPLDGRARPGHGRLAAWGDRRRELRVSDDGVSVPGRPSSG